MCLAIKLFEEGSPADEHLVFLVVVAGNFAREVTVGEAHFEFVAVHEARSDDLNHSVSLAWSTLRVDFVDADRGVE